MSQHSRVPLLVALGSIPIVTSRGYPLLVFQWCPQGTRSRVATRTQRARDCRTPHGPQHKRLGGHIG